MIFEFWLVKDRPHAKGAEGAKAGTEIPKSGKG